MEGMYIIWRKKIRLCFRTCSRKKKRYLVEGQRSLKCQSLVLAVIWYSYRFGQLSNNTIFDLNYRVRQFSFNLVTEDIHPLKYTKKTEGQGMKHTLVQIKVLWISITLHHTDVWGELRFQEFGFDFRINGQHLLSQVEYLILYASLKKDFIILLKSFFRHLRPCISFAESVGQDQPAHTCRLILPCTLRCLIASDTANFCYRNLIQWHLSNSHV